MNKVPTVLSDAGPLIALGKLNRLELLADLYHQVQMPRAVYSEVVTQGLARGAPEALTIRLFWQSQDLAHSGCANHNSGCLYAASYARSG